MGPYLTEQVLGIAACGLGVVLAAAQPIDTGLTFRVIAASVASDGTISVRYKVTDSAGAPLDLAGKRTFGAIRVRHQAVAF